MSKKYLWQAFLIVVGCFALWYTGLAAYRYYSYKRLNAQARLETIHWNIEEISEEKFIPEASYTFKVNQEAYSGKTSWLDQTYRNRWGAEQSLPEFSDQWHKVWYDAQNPNHSSLQKKFPFKDSISAGLLWGLWLYFFWLGYYVSKMKRKA